MEEHNMTESGEDLSPEVLKRALKAFKKRLKLTALDEDSRLGRGAFSAGAQGYVPSSPPTSIRPKCGPNCAARANSAIAAMGFLNSHGLNKISK